MIMSIKEYVSRIEIEDIQRAWTRFQRTAVYSGLIAGGSYAMAVFIAGVNAWDFTEFQSQDFWITIAQIVILTTLGASGPALNKLHRDVKGK